MNPKDKFIEKERRVLPFFIEFVKFTTGFVAIVAISLFLLNIVTSSIKGFLISSCSDSVCFVGTEYSGSTGPGVARDRRKSCRGNLFVRM